MFVLICVCHRLTKPNKQWHHKLQSSSTRSKLPGIHAPNEGASERLSSSVRVPSSALFQSPSKGPNLRPLLRSSRPNWRKHRPRTLCEMQERELLVLWGRKRQRNSLLRQFYPSFLGQAQWWLWARTPQAPKLCWLTRGVILALLKSWLGRSQSAYII